MNVLSIDFDWIMEPVIEAYNHISGSPVLKYDDCWNIIKKKLPDTKFYCNNNLLNKIFEIVEKFPNRIVIGENHEEILQMINDEPVDMLVNIDHHHDCYGFSLDRNNEIHCGNWVDYLFQNDLLGHYIWVTNYTSDPNQGKFNTYPSDKVEIDSNVDAILKFVKFDKIFLCLSPNWIPPQCLPLWKMLLNHYRTICENDALRKSEE